MFTLATFVQESCTEVVDSRCHLQRNLSDAVGCDVLRRTGNEALCAVTGEGFKAACRIANTRRRHSRLNAARIPATDTNIMTTS